MDWEITQIHTHTYSNELIKSKALASCAQKKWHGFVNGNGVMFNICYFIWFVSSLNQLQEQNIRIIGINEKIATISVIFFNLRKCWEMNVTCVWKSVRDIQIRWKYVCSVCMYGLVHKHNEILF